MQAEYAVKHKPKGNYVLIGGAPTDNNALLLREGQMKSLKPLVDKGDDQDRLRPVGEGLAGDRGAQDHGERAHPRRTTRWTRWWRRNDGTAGGAIQALAEQKLAGKVLVTGQDADLAACQRIVAGTQTMTIYKPIQAARQQGGGGRRSCWPGSSRSRRDDRP